MCKESNHHILPSRDARGIPSLQGIVFQGPTIYRHCVKKLLRPTWAKSVSLFSNCSCQSSPWKRQAAALQKVFSLRQRWNSRA